jgi:hypothetical protein
MRTRDAQSGVLVLLGVLFTIILAGLDNTIVSTVIPVALPELGGAQLYAWTFAAYMRARAQLGPGRGARLRRWHGNAIARTHCGGAEQRARGPHGQRDDEPAIDHSRSRARASNLAAPRPCRGSPCRSIHPQVGAALGVSAFVLAATAGGFRVALLPMIAVSAGAFACILVLPTHSVHRLQK